MKKTYILLVVIIAPFFAVAQDQVLLDYSWFVQAGHNSSTNSSWNTILNEIPEVRTEIVFFNDKMVVQDCCGGEFEMDVNYVSNNEILFLNLTEIQSGDCSPLGVYSSLKDIFNTMVGETITFTIHNDLEPGVKYFSFDHPTNNSFVTVYNIPNEINEQSRAPYWGHEPPTHVWSLTKVEYQGEIYELPYGAALTVADIFQGTFTISLCGEIVVALNFSWYLDVEDLTGPCFISCGILENIPGECEPVAGYDSDYLEGFKQSVFNFLNGSIDELMGYTYTGYSTRKLILERYYPIGDKLVFHSNANYASIDESIIASAITVYPNPTADEVFIYKQQEGIINVGLYSISGQLLLEKEFGNTNNFMSLQNVSSGTYFLVIENQLGEKTVKKVVKK